MLVIAVLCFLGSASAQEYRLDGENTYNDTVNSVLAGKIRLNPKDIINGILKDTFSEVIHTKALVKSILAIAVASGVLKVPADSVGNEGVTNAAFYGCFLVMTSASIKVFNEAAHYGADVIHSVCTFITKFEPVFVGVLAASGAVTQAAAFQPVMTASVYVLSLLTDKCILPLVYFSAVLGIVNNMGTRIEISTLNKLVNSFSKWLLTGVLTLFSAILTLYGFGTCAFNNVAAKGIKFAVGSFVPVVGGILSETIDTVISGAGLMKNAVGTGGMIAVISLAAVPIIKIWVMMMLLKICAAVCEPFSSKQVTGVLLSVSEAVSSLFSIVITSCALFVISIGIILMSTGVSL